MKEISLLKPLIKQIISEILKKNQGGVYLRAEPLEKVPMIDAPPMLKIKEIDEHNLFEAIDLYEIEE